MKSIIQIVDDVVVIGDDESNSITEVRRVDCSFEPAVGDKVNLFANETKMIVTKINEAPLPINNITTTPTQDKIHINIVNDNSHKNDLPSVPYGVLTQKNVVQKTTYLLWAFFLGAIGAHKFYAGKTGMGILYLVFCWTYIPGVVALIEFILACFKTPDAQGRIIV